jgi:hypothetical protein
MLLILKKTLDATGLGIANSVESWLTGALIVRPTTFYSQAIESFGEMLQGGFSMTMLVMPAYFLKWANSIRLLNCKQVHLIGRINKTRLATAMSFMLWINKVFFIFCFC